MGEIEKLPAREEIADADKWALEDLFATDTDWEHALTVLEEEFAQLKSYEGKVSASADALYAYLTLADRTENLFEKVLVYSNEDMQQRRRLQLQSCLLPALFLNRSCLHWMRTDCRNFLRKTRNWKSIGY